MRKIKKGRIDYSSLNKKPENHELAVANYFANLGIDITFIKPSNIKGSNSPDFWMQNKVWEVKSPIKYGYSSFEDNVKKAMKQSEHIIFDLRRLSIKDEEKYKKGLAKRKEARRIKTLIIITREGVILTLKGSLV